MIDWILLRIFPRRRIHDQTFDDRLSVDAVREIGRLERRSRAATAVLNSWPLGVVVASASCTVALWSVNETGVGWMFFVVLWMTLGSVFLLTYMLSRYRDKLRVARDLAIGYDMGRKQ